jgi:hypothetical protein
LGKLGQPVPQHQLQVLLAAFFADGMLGRATTQAIGKVMLGMLYMGRRVPDAQLQLLLAELAAKSQEAMPQDLANSLWAVARLGQQVSQQQLEQLVAAFVSKLSTAKTQHIANTLWAAAEMCRQLAADQRESMLAAFVRQLDAAAPQEVSMILMACARFRHVPVLLLAALEQEEHMQRYLAAANPKSLAKAARALNTLGYNGPLLLGLELAKQ